MQIKKKGKKTEEARRKKLAFFTSAESFRAARVGTAKVHHRSHPGVAPHVGMTARQLSPTRHHPNS